MMKYIKKHNMTARLLLLAAAVTIILFCYTLKKADENYTALCTGGDLPEKYTVNGFDVSGMSILEARSRIKDELGSQQVELCDTKIRIDEFTDIDVAFAPEDLNIWNYFLKKGDLNAVVTYQVDKKRLKKVIKGLVCIKTEDARICYKNEEAVIVPEVYGNVLKVTDEVIERLEEAMTTGQEPELAQFYRQPEVISADLVNDLKKASAWNHYSLDVLVDGVFVDQISMGGHLRWNGKQAVVSRKWVKQEISRLAGSMDTYGKTRDFVTNGGMCIQIPGGTMGWLLNQEQTEQAVYEAVKNKHSSMELMWDNKGAAFWNAVAGNDIGETYVEVSIDSQKVWFYKNGTLKLESSIVTGLPTQERQTKIGVHHILYRQRDRVLRGSAGAWNSFVNYWMPFTLDGQGLHDASWRRKFGGSIYKSNGSHGCVNLPVGFASQLYIELETGTPVIVY